MRILGLDLGSKTLGVSVSDALGMIARPVETIRFESDDYDAAFEQVHVSRKKRKKIIDQMAAVQILQSYLDSKN